MTGADGAGRARGVAAEAVTAHERKREMRTKYDRRTRQDRRAAAAVAAATMQGGLSSCRRFCGARMSKGPRRRSKSQGTPAQQTCRVCHRCGRPSLGCRDVRRILL